MIKKELAARLLSLEGVEKDHSEWKKPHEKIKNSFLIQEAAKVIAKKKIDIQALSEENAKLLLQIEKLTVTCDKNSAKNKVLQKRKQDLSDKYQALHEENLKMISVKEQDLAKIEDKNQEIRAEIDSITSKKEREIMEAEKRIEKLMAISEASKVAIREEKQLKMKYQRSVFTLQHLVAEHQSLKAVTESQEKRLSILTSLLEASKEHLSKSIEQKSMLLNQTSDAAEKMCVLCEETLKEEQSFYEEREFDKMHTPPYINVKRRPR